MQTLKSGDNFTSISSVQSRSSGKSGRDRRKENATAPAGSSSKEKEASKEVEESRPPSIKAPSTVSGSEKDSHKTTLAANDSTNNSASTSPSTAPSTGTVNPVSPLLAPVTAEKATENSTLVPEKEKSKGKGKNKEQHLSPGNSRPGSLKGGNEGSTPSRPSSIRRGLSKILPGRRSASSVSTATLSSVSSPPNNPTSPESGPEDSTLKNPTHLSIPPSATSANTDGGSNRSPASEGAINEEKENNVNGVVDGDEKEMDQDADADADTVSLAGSFKTSLTTGDNETSGETSQSVGNSPPGLSKSQRRVTFLCEQVSHHPPISSFYCECKESGVQVCGVDQLSAKFTGTNIKIFSGEQNQGIFVKLTENAKCGAAGEEYQITHPTASINGMFRGSLWVAISDTLHVTCRDGKREKDNGKRLRTIVEYKDESWVMKAKYALEGVVYEWDPENEE